MNLSYVLVILLLVFVVATDCRNNDKQPNLRQSKQQNVNHHDLYGSNADQQHNENDARSLQSLNAYYKNTNFGKRSYNVTLGNPFKGLTANPNIGNPYLTGVAFSTEAFYFGFDQVVRGENVYNWTTFEEILNKCMKRNAHAIPRFFIHYPGNPLAVPEYLERTASFGPYATNGREGISPYYDDPIMLEAIQNFIKEFGRKYDGDKRIAIIQAGILGFWGEWHTSGSTTNFLPDWVIDEVSEWYGAAFSITPVQGRYPTLGSEAAKLGYHDDSFGYATIDGIYNGGVIRTKFFWNRVLEAGAQHFWQYAPMGGEIRPENTNDIFEIGYPVNTEYHQDFRKCVEITHATYMKNALLFRDTNMTSYEVSNANSASTLMGYNFEVVQVDAYKIGNRFDAIAVEVTVEQIGVAPFYYPLAIELSCNTKTIEVAGVEKLIKQFDTKKFMFTEVPAVSECLDGIRIRLVSPRLYANNPIKFAQGLDGKIEFSVPLPPLTTPAPTLIPSATPILPPTMFPVAAVPMAAPISSPIVPDSVPIAEPISSPIVRDSVPIAAPISSPIVPVSVPVAAPTLSSPILPMSAPITASTSAPVLTPVLSSLSITFTPTRKPVSRGLPPITAPVTEISSPIQSPVPPSSTPAVPTSPPIAADVPVSFDQTNDVITAFYMYDKSKKSIQPLLNDDVRIHRRKTSDDLKVGVELIDDVTIRNRIVKIKFAWEERSFFIFRRTYSYEANAEPYILDSTKDGASSYLTSLGSKEITATAFDSNGVIVGNTATIRFRIRILF